MNKAEQIKQDGYKDRYLKEQEAKIRKWLGDAVRLDEYGHYVWTQPDHHMLLSNGDDLTASNPNIDEYYNFAVDAINGKIKGKYSEYENTIMQEFTYEAGYQNIKSGSMNIFCLRGWGEISSSDIRSPAVFHDDLGYWIADTLECKRKADYGGGVDMTEQEYADLQEAFNICYDHLCDLHFCAVNDRIRTEVFLKEVLQGIKKTAETNEIFIAKKKEEDERCSNT